MMLDDYDYKFQDQLICLKEDIGAKNNYNEINIGHFCISVINYYTDSVHILMKYFSSIQEYIFM